MLVLFLIDIANFTSGAGQGLKPKMFLVILCKSDLKYRLIKFDFRLANCTNKPFFDDLGNIPSQYRRLKTSTFTELLYSLSYFHCMFL